MSVLKPEFQPDFKGRGRSARYCRRRRDELVQGCRQVVSEIRQVMSSYRGGEDGSDLERCQVWGRLLDEIEMVLEKVSLRASRSTKVFRGSSGRVA